MDRSFSKSAGRMDGNTDRADNAPILENISVESLTGLPNFSVHLHKDNAQAKAFGKSN